MYSISFSYLYPLGREGSPCVHKCALLCTIPIGSTFLNSECSIFGSGIRIRNWLGLVPRTWPLALGRGTPHSLPKDKTPRPKVPEGSVQVQKERAAWQSRTQTEAKWRVGRAYERTTRHGRLEADSLSLALALCVVVLLQVDVDFRFVLLPSRCAQGGALVSFWRWSRTGGCSRPLLESKCAARVRHRAL